MSIGITSTHKSSAGTIAEGGSPTESKVAQPGYLQEGSHVLAKTSNKTAFVPKEGLIFNILSMTSLLVINLLTNELKN